LPNQPFLAFFSVNANEHYHNKDLALLTEDTTMRGSKAHLPRGPVRAEGHRERFNPLVDQDFHLRVVGYALQSKGKLRSLVKPSEMIANGRQGRERTKVISNTSIVVGMVVG
jgi:hypothetical protein